MGLLSGLFGGETNIWTILLALIIVVALIFFGVWILKLIFKASVTIAGGRKRRLAMVDSLAIDNKRNIILVRRDDVEHLILITNTGELLIEGSIPANIANSELKTPASSPTIRKSPSLDDKKTGGITAGTLAADSAAAGAVAAIASSRKNSTVDEKPQNSPDKRLVADRLGLSRLLRRNDEAKNIQKEPAPMPAPDHSPQTQKISPPIVAPSPASTSAQKIVSEAIKAAPSKDQTSKTAPVFTNNTVTPLRTTGILKPVSEMSGANSDISQTQNETKSPPVKDVSVADNSVPAKDSHAKDSHAKDNPIEDSPFEKDTVAISTIKEIPTKDNSVEESADKIDESRSKKTSKIKSSSEDASDFNEPPTKQTAKTIEQKKTEEVTSEKQDNIKAFPPDSAKNEVQQIDAKAMESIEEGTNSGNDGAKSNKKDRDSGSEKGPKPSEKTS